MPVTVIDAVAAGIGGDQERLVPLGMKQRRQRMRLVMIVEINLGVIAKAAGAAELRDIENIVDARGVVAANFAEHEPARVLLDIFSILLAQPAHAANGAVKFGRELAAAYADDVDVLAGDAADTQHLVDGEVRILPPVALVAGQPLELHRGTQRIILEQRGARVVHAGVHGEDELGHEG